MTPIRRYREKHNPSADSMKTPSTKHALVLVCLNARGNVPDRNPRTQQFDGWPNEWVSDTHAAKCWVGYAYGEDVVVWLFRILHYYNAFDLFILWR